MVKVKKCCCCIPVKTGAMIIGSVHVLGLLIGLYLVAPLQISLEIFCGAAFLLMVYRDSQQKRLFYFSAYVIYAASLGTIRMIFVFWDHDEKLLVRNYCNAVDEKVVQADQSGLGWGITDYADYEDCKHKVGTGVLIDEFIYLAISLLI